MKTLLALFALLCVLPLRAEDPLDFFPHHLGDTWVYTYPPDDKLKSTITKVWTDADQNIFISHNNATGATFTIDKDYYVHFIGEKEYKLDAHQDDTWTVLPYNKEKGDLRIEAWLTKEYKTFVLGKLTTVKEIAYFTLLPKDTVISDHAVYMYTQFLAAGIGVYKQIGEAGTLDYEVTGCIINGETLGVVTSVSKSQESEFIHLSNFPNPCHSFTSLHFSVLTYSAHLEITDIFGNTVLSIHQENVQKGENSYTVHTANWKPGMYFCRLTDGRQTVMRKMIVY